ncbi:MAG TPA: ATP-binding protein [Thermoanaerobaculia bacterium]|nr:ATP-binding protein [Thermoanaerobaculia bacterium]
MSSAPLYPRLASGRLAESLRDSPIVLIHGPRQSGKTTLARTVGEPRGYGYFTFDDDVARTAAEADPAGFVDDLPRRVILDEVQRVPSLFTALKRAVDRDRAPGRFILTGSANVLLVPRLSDSLAGRMEILRLHPLAQAEIERRRPRFLDFLFAAAFKTRSAPRLGDELVTRIVSGGYPPALTRAPGRRRQAWYRDYVAAIVERDVRELGRIAALHAMPRLLSAAASQTARLLNVSELAAPFELSRPTIREYLTLLERVFLLDVVPPWHSNRLSRLVKTPKVHIGDSGLACALLDAGEETLRDDRALLGQMLETFVYQELRREAGARDEALHFFHFRDRDGAEVDIVIERGARGVAGIEIKAAATVHPSDFRGLRRLKEATGKRFTSGVVLYDGETTASFGENLFAVPVRALWE